MIKWLIFAGVIGILGWLGWFWWTNRPENQPGYRAVNDALDRARAAIDRVVALQSAPQG